MPNINPFQWGQGGQALTPQEAARQRAVAQALVNRSAPQNVGQGLNRIGEALLHRSLTDRASEAERMGRESASDVFSGISGGNADLDALMQAADNPWLSDGQKSVVNAMLGQQLTPENPMDAINLQKAQIELENLRNPAAPVPKPTASQLDFEYGQENPEFADYQKNLRSAGSTNVTVNGDQTSEFRKATDKKDAEMFITGAEAGMAARRKAIQIDALDRTLSQSGSGMIAGLTSMAGKMGIDIGDAGPVQAAEAIISQMVPSQRVAGSGTMSDADLALFKASLPSLMNTPDGNKRIIDTMRAINQYEIQIGEISDAVIDSSMTRKEGRDAMRAIPNPLEGFAPQVQPEIASPIDGAPQAGQEMDGFVFNGGDPADPNNWSPVGQEFM